MRTQPGLYFNPKQSQIFSILLVGHAILTRLALINWIQTPTVNEWFCVTVRTDRYQEKFLTTENFFKSLNY